MKTGQEIAAVLDTNVLFDIFSCHDLDHAYRRAADPADPATAYRRHRARDALLLAVFLDRGRATTLSVKEALRLFPARVDPDASDEFPTHFVTLAAAFVKDRLLGGWQDEIIEDGGVAGSAADLCLLRAASEHGVPLITNEGSSPTEIRPVGLRKRAIKEGIQVFTPGAFWVGKLEPNEASCSFLTSFRKQTELYLASHPRPEIARESLAWMLEYYQVVLFQDQPQAMY